MEIDVKYKLGQQVWYNSIPKPKTISVKALRILCTYNGYTGEYWGDSGGPPGSGWPFRIQYSDQQSPKDDQWISQELLFPSLEELVKHLSKQ